MNLFDVRNPKERKIILCACPIYVARLLQAPRPHVCESHTPWNGCTRYRLPKEIDLNYLTSLNTWMYTSKQ